MDTVTGGEMALRMMQLGGVGCINRFLSVEEQVSAVNMVQIEKRKMMNDYLPPGTPKLINFKYPICASIGVNDSIVRLDKLVKAGVNIILIDVAHGNTKLMKDAIKRIKETYVSVDIIAGNVATAEGAKNLCEWGADAIRVGIGNGSLCETRIRTGVGVPQVTALIDTIKIADEYGVPVIADGGIRMVGDVAKALALGADSVMLGSFLAGTKETPGTISKSGVFPNEQLYKRYRGSASLETKMEHNLSEKNVEGNSKLVPYKGKIKRILDEMTYGLSSAMSYVGAYNIEEFRVQSTFVRVTQNGMIEAKPHLLL
jgi:IMP dehydrogenase